MTAGLIVDPGVTDDAIRATLDAQLPRYLDHLAALDRQRRGDHGLAEVAPPRSWRTSTGPVEENGDLWPTRLLPAVYISYEGITTEPARRASGGYSVAYRYEIAAVVAAPGHEALVRLSKLYFAALVGAILQGDPSLGGHAATIDWVGGDAGIRIPAPQGRLLAGCGAQFDIHVDDVINVFDDLDHTPVEANTSHITVDHREEGE